MHKKNFIFFLFLLILSCEGINNPPILSPIGNRSVRVGDTLIIELIAIDPDGDNISFEVIGAPESSKITKKEEIGIFTFSPIISQAKPGGRKYPVIFIAKDGHGGIAKEEIIITVYPEGGVPVFLSPSGYILNLAEKEKIAFIIEVKDDDSPKVDFKLHKSIDGAIFDIIDKKKASFYWKPREEQIKEKNFYYIDIGAKDEVYEEVRQEIVILLLNQDFSKKCNGSPPSIIHSPLPDQKGYGDYKIETLIYDEESEIKEAFLYWTFKSPEIESNFKKIALKREDEFNWIGIIPNTTNLLQNGKKIYYYITVKDNDDFYSDYCDHIVKIPKNEFFYFLIYDPSLSKKCFDDIYEPNDSSDTAKILKHGKIIPARICSENEDWFKFSAKEGEIIDILPFFEPSHGSINLTFFGSKLETLILKNDSPLHWKAKKSGEYFLKIESDGNDINYRLLLLLSLVDCPSDIYENNDRKNYATSINTSSSHSLSICPADIDWFRLNLSEGDFLHISVIPLNNKGDIDIAFFKEGEKNPLKISQNTGIKEEIKLNISEGGIYYLKVYGNNGESNKYDLNIGIIQNFCKDDLFSPNHLIKEAFIIPTGVYTKLILCPQKSDLFKIGLNGGEKITALAETENGFLNVRIFDKDGFSEIGEVIEKEGMSFSQAKVFNSGNYYIKVSSDKEKPIFYSLKLSIQEQEGKCISDRFEANNSPKSATQLPSHWTTHLTLCTKDVDFFAEDLGIWEKISVYLHYDVFKSDIELSLINGENEEIIKSGESMESGKFLSYVAKKSGKYFIKVEEKTKNFASYDIGIFIE